MQLIWKKSPYSVIYTWIREKLKAFELLIAVCR